MRGCCYIVAVICFFFSIVLILVDSLRVLASINVHLRSVVISNFVLNETENNFN